MGLIGGAVAQPGLGRVADVYGYGAAYVVAGAIQVLGILFAILARRQRAASDPTRPRPDGRRRGTATGPEGPVREEVGGGGRYWIRTSDPADVNRVL